ncbi:winged helix-turn-helix domain-containing protein [Thaumasiovibrio subtropicus]|uniref:winged helix-turn-helix domain-containing protein n=1 Tax=Thaumasiovibrio subtropicus TaxID=1891207 RepID=UPI000B34EF6F|nr:helix-turn-helix domain-containing protein [Thaumasiovibrio subtropicus]
MHYFLINDEYLFNHRSGRLIELSTREEIQLRSNEWKLLYFFVLHPGEDLSTDAILAEIWQQARAKSNVTTTVKKLRQQLKDNPDAPRFIQTQVMKGYAFIGEVQTLDETAYQQRLEKESDKRQRAIQWIIAHSPRPILLAVNILCLIGIYHSLLPLYLDWQKGYANIQTPSIQIVPLTYAPIDVKIDSESVAMCQSMITDTQQQSLYEIIPVIGEFTATRFPTLYWSTAERKALVCQFAPILD